MLEEDRIFNKKDQPLIAQNYRKALPDFSRMMFSCGKELQRIHE